METAKKDQIVSGNKKGSKMPKTINLSSSEEVEYPDNSIDTKSSLSSDALRRSERRFYTLYYQSPIAIEHFDKRGKLIDVNPSCLSLFGVNNLEDLRNFDLFADPNLSVEQKKMLKRKEIVQYQGLFDFEKVRKFKLYPTKKSGKIWIDSRITPLINNQDTIDGYLVQVFDITDRMIANKAIRESEEKYRTLFENVQDVFYKIDMKGNFIEISPSIKYFSEFDRDELIGQSVIKIYANSKDRVLFLNNLMKTGELRDYELKLKSKTGKIIYSSINARLIFNRNGKAAYIAGAIRDITERKLAEEALHESEEKYRRLFDNASQAIVVSQGDVLQFVNPKACEIFGYSREELLSIPFIEFIFADDKQMIAENYKNRLQDRPAPQNYTFRIFRKDKTIRWVEASVVLFQWNGKNASLNYLTDITERKKAKEELKESKKKYQFIVENTNDILWTMNPDFTFDYISPSVYKFLGYTVEEHFKQRMEDFLVPESVKMITDEFQQGMMNLQKKEFDKLRDSADIEVEFIRKDKTHGYASINMIMIRDENHNIIKIRGITSNITERKKAEDELHNSIEQLHQLTKYIEEVRELERLAISRELHDDLGQALTAVIIDLSMIRQKIADQEIVRKIEKVSGLVSITIKSVQRLTSNLRPDIIFDLGLDAAIELYTKEFTERSGIKVFLKMHEGLFFPNNIALNIFRIIQESLTNISRHAKATKVDVMLMKTFDSVCIKISDNGIGVNEDDIKSKTSFGIMSMKERAKTLGGSLDIYKKNHTGTEIKLILPLPKNMNQ